MDEALDSVKQVQEKQERGSALIIALSIGLVLAGYCATILTMSHSEGSLSFRNFSETQARYAADGGILKTIRDFKNITQHVGIGRFELAMRVLDTFDDNPGTLYIDGELFGSEDIDGDGVLDNGEDLDDDGVLDDGEDVNGNGVLDLFAEDLNMNGRLDPGEDFNSNSTLEGIDEDKNNNHILDGPVAAYDVEIISVVSRSFEDAGLDPLFTTTGSGGAGFCRDITFKATGYYPAKYMPDGVTIEPNAIVHSVTITVRYSIARAIFTLVAYATYNHSYFGRKTTDTFAQSLGYGAGPDESDGPMTTLFFSDSNVYQDHIWGNVGSMGIISFDNIPVAITGYSRPFVVTGTDLWGMADDNKDKNDNDGGVYSNWLVQKWGNLEGTIPLNGRWSAGQIATGNPKTAFEDTDGKGFKNIHFYKGRFGFPNPQMNDLTQYENVINNYHKSWIKLSGESGRIEDYYYAIGDANPNNYSDPDTDGVWGNDAPSSGDNSERYDNAGQWEPRTFVAFGSPTAPIELHGPVVIQGDLVIGGFISGQGSLLVHGNTYIVEDIIAWQTPHDPLDNTDRVKGTNHGSDGKVYNCIIEHTSAADTRPTSGANWQTYWEEALGGAASVWASGKAYEKEVGWWPSFTLNPYTNAARDFHRAVGVGTGESVATLWNRLNVDFDALSIYCNGNIVIGDLYEPNARAFADMWRQNTTCNNTKEDAGLDELSGTRYGYDGILGTYDDDILEDDGIWSVEYYTATELALYNQVASDNSLANLQDFDGNDYVAGDAIPKTGEDYDADGVEDASQTPISEFTVDWTGMTFGGNVDYLEYCRQTMEDIMVPAVSYTSTNAQISDQVTRTLDLFEYCGTLTDKVIGSDNSAYLCTTNHTATTDDKPITGANWATKWKKVAVPWALSAAYVADTDKVIGTDGNVYICKVGHTSVAGTKPISGASWAARWEKIGRPDGDWKAGINYTNDVDGNKIYQTERQEGYQSDWVYWDEYVGLQLKPNANKSDVFTIESVNGTTITLAESGGSSVYGDGWEVRNRCIATDKARGYVFNSGLDLVVIDIGLTNWPTWWGNQNGGAGALGNGDLTGKDLYISFAADGYATKYEILNNLYSSTAYVLHVGSDLTALIGPYTQGQDMVEYELLLYGTDADPPTNEYYPYTENAVQDRAATRNDMLAGTSMPGALEDFFLAAGVNKKFSLWDKDSALQVLNLTGFTYGGSAAIDTDTVITGAGGGATMEATLPAHDDWLASHTYQIGAWGIWTSQGQSAGGAYWFLHDANADLPKSALITSESGWYLSPTTGTSDLFTIYENLATGFVVINSVRDHFTGGAPGIPGESYSIVKADTRVRRIDALLYSHNSVIACLRRGGRRTTNEAFSTTAYRWGNMVIHGGLYCRNDYLFQLSRDMTIYHDLRYMRGIKQSYRGGKSLYTPITWDKIRIMDYSLTQSE